MQTLSRPAADAGLAVLEALAGAAAVGALGAGRGALGVREATLACGTPGRGGAVGIDAWRRGVRDAMPCGWTPRPRASGAAPRPERGDRAARAAAAQRALRVLARLVGRGTRDVRERAPARLERVGRPTKNLN